VTTASPDVDRAHSVRPPTQGWARIRPAAVILAASQRVVSGYGGDTPVPAGWTPSFYGLVATNPARLVSPGLVAAGPGR
jgi:hypothetical protein